MVTSAADKNSNIIFGSVIDESLEDEVRVTVIATGFDGAAAPQRHAPDQRPPRRRLRRPDTPRARDRGRRHRHPRVPEVIRAPGYLAIVVALFLVGCGGGEDGGSEDLAKGKVFEVAELQSCLRKARFTIQPRDTESGIDFSARSRSGLVNVDIGVERGPEDAVAREEAWRKLAEQAEVEDIDAYYFRYGNVVVAYEQVPSDSDRAPVERCLS